MQLSKPLSSLMPRCTVDKTEPVPVKFQVITREGQDIIVGRVKIPTVRDYTKF
jgi:hypothetical protein